ncbi:hypothetical protein SAY86_010819 [Trapa natans]|uniref:Anaphase-promoting complex subunit 4 n=1 Tax=Trapa natans TaxID=22666 RepID=A0AAN7LJ03_TRANT|nr:hypothetical protein SAY86_010819 [Trapa natans]
MESDDGVQRVIPFQLQFDKPLASHVRMAEWNPEKDLLAMVTEDSKVMLHRFNWQRLWTISPGKNVSSLCWRPDGKALALGLEDGTVTLHDVENGKLLRSLNSHAASVVCLNWEEDVHLQTNGCGNYLSFEDRTPRFFPPAPRVPRMPGLVSGDAGFTEDGQDSFMEFSNSSNQRFNILCSGHTDGTLLFSIFGIFPVGKINIHSCRVPYVVQNTQTMCRLLNSSIVKVALSKDLSHLTVTCHGELVEDSTELRDGQMGGHCMRGLHCFLLDTSIFQKRKKELHQVAQQASNIDDLREVARASISVMNKQWSDAMSTFHEKFNSLSNLISDHGLDSSPQEEFLSLLLGARTSPPIHQFLVNSLGESGMKRVSKVVSNAGKELQLVVLNHLQPAAEIIAFRMGELRGFSRWHARYQGIGLDEALMDCAAEKAGMLLVQVERFMRVLSSVVQQFSNFFTWLLKCIKMLMSEPSDQLLSYNSELVVVFLKFLYDQDPVKQLLDTSEADHHIGIDMETKQRVRELIQFGGFLDAEFLERTLAKEFLQMELSFKEAVGMPFSTISKKIICEKFLLLSPLTTLPSYVPISLSYYEDPSRKVSFSNGQGNLLVDYISFQISDDDSAYIGKCIVILRGLTNVHERINMGENSIEAVLLSVPDGYYCVDLSLYKESQIVLLLNEGKDTSDSSGNAYLMILQASELPFSQISISSHINDWELHQLKDSILHLKIESEKARTIPHPVISPLAVSASRGVACVFAAKKRALVYILDEDEEDESSDSE